MKFLKGLLIVLVVLVVLVLVVALFLPKEVTILRSTEIEKPVETVFAVLSGFEQRTEWDPWAEIDPDSKITLSGPTSGVGAKYAWAGEKTGEGHMEIVNVRENERIESKLVFTKPQQSKAKVVWEFSSTDNGVKVEWLFHTELKYPVERFFGLMMEGMLAPDLERGLKNLKEFAESMPDPEMDMEMDEESEEM